MARWEALLKTFSNTRGTARMNVGLNSPRSVTRFLMSALWPILARLLTQPTWMMRAKTWASGRKSRVEAPSVSKRSASSSTATPSSNMKLPWVSMQPLGLPVVPLV